VVVDIKQHKSQFRNSNITSTQCQKNCTDIRLFQQTFSIAALWLSGLISGLKGQSSVIKISVEPYSSKTAFFFVF